MAKYCTECGTKVTPSMKYCPECGKKISKKSQNNSKENNKNTENSTKKKAKHTNKKTNSKKTSSKKKKTSKKKKQKTNRKLIIGLSFSLFGILLLVLCIAVIIPSTTNSDILINNTGLLKIDPNSIEELTEDDIASKEGYFCRIKSDNGVFYIKKSEIKSLNGLDKSFLAKIRLKELSNNQEIYVISEVYDLNGNKL